MNADLLQTFAPDDLRPREGEEAVRVGDLAEFWLVDGAAGARGWVSEILSDEYARVRLPDIGTFAVPLAFLTLVRRPS